MRKLRNCRGRLFGLLEVIDIRPDRLDPQADTVHENLVIPVYELMSTEVAYACGSLWAADGQQRFGDFYHDTANKWPAYREALAELKGVRDKNMSVVDAMVKLEGPRSAYIAALLSFYIEFSATLDFFFPPRTRGGSHTGS
jgi:hypothetical protein